MSHRHSWDDTWLPADLCADLDDGFDCPKKKRFDHDFRFKKDFDDDKDDDLKFKKEHDFRFKKDFKDDDCGCDDHHGHHFDHFKKKKRKAIRVGEVTVDCTPVTFRTPGQAINVVSCPVSQVLNVPVTRTVNVQVPLGIDGCVLNVPLTEQVQVPVVTTVNTPPIQTPVPTVVCPPFTGRFGF